VKETVYDEAREDQFGVRSLDKVQHTSYLSLFRLGHDIECLPIATIMSIDLHNSDN